MGNRNVMHDRTNRRTVLQALGAIGAAGLVPPAAAQESDEPAYPSLEWYQRELENFDRTLQAPREQTMIKFQERLQKQSVVNATTSLRQSEQEPEWRRAGNASLTWEEVYAGDPFRFPSVDPFYGSVGETTRVAFYDADGARLNGRVWVPADSEPGDNLPAVVIVNGSLEETEAVYWWAAHTLVENGYMVMTYDPRGQGRSDSVAENDEAGTNINPSIFVTDQVSAIDFLHSTPDDPYVRTQSFGNENNSAPEFPFNPYHDRLDPDRLGVAGHSAGALAVSVAQGLQPWPGVHDEENPIDVAVAWDNLGTAEQIGDSRTALLTDFHYDVIGVGPYEVKPRVPSMGLAGDYFLVPVPYISPPNPEAHRLGFNEWKAAGIPSYQVVIRGGTHWEFANNPLLPATSWRPPNKQEPGAEEPFGEGNQLVDYFTLAWFDRWLKEPGEQGYDTADDRLLADEQFVDDLSFYFQSARDYPTRQGNQQVKEDIRGDASGNAGLIGGILDDADDDLAGGILGNAYENLDDFYDNLINFDKNESSSTSSTLTLNQIVTTNELSADIPDAAQGTPLAGSLQGMKALDKHLQRSDDPKSEELRSQVTQPSQEVEKLIPSLFG